MRPSFIRPVRAQDVAWITQTHAQLYGRDEGFDNTFGPLVADILAAFFADHDHEREAGWIVDGPNGPLGCIFCVNQSKNTAKLRLFLVQPEARGQGLGKRLLSTCTSFARKAGYHDMTLATHESHRAACGLYAASGWTLQTSEPVRSFGQDLVEQVWTRRL